MGFEVVRKGNTFDVLVDGRLFTSCVYEPEYVRPFMGPVKASDGAEFTRTAPHHENHPHQRSLFVGIGNVNGVDFWNEVGAGKGKMELLRVLECSGGEEAVVSVELLWSAIDTGEKLLHEVRTHRFSAQTDCITVRLTCEFTAVYQDITFGITKEAGPLGIRVSDALRVKDGGEFINSEGGINEENCWGKTAKWCNYYAVVNGRKIGIAAFDSPENTRYPTAWHIRNYGLMAANNLLFKGEEHIRKGDTLRYQYKICFWENAFDPQAHEK